MRWALRNCAAWPYAVAVPSRPLLGGPAEARWAAGPHATSSGSTVVEPGWTLEVEPDASAPLPSAYLGPKRVLDDVPGRIVEVEVEVGPSGDWSYQVQVDGGRISTIVSVCRQAG